MTYKTVFWLFSVIFVLTNSAADVRKAGRLVLCITNADATFANDDEVVIFDGHDHNTTVEGPEFYRRNGYYYICPGGGT